MQMRRSAKKFASFSVIAALVAANLFAVGTPVAQAATSFGKISTVAGTTLNIGDNGPATSAILTGPQGIASDAAGNIYLAERTGQRVRKIDASTGIATTFAGNGNAGFSGDSGQATSATLSNPSAVTVNASGNVYVADNANNRIRKIDASTGIISTIAGTGTAGSAGDGGLATSAQLNLPRGLVFDATGTLYIADTSNNRIRKIDASTGIISTIAGTGTAGSSGDGGLATAAKISGPFDVTVDTTGNVYIADTASNRIRKVDASTGIISTIAGTGTAGFSGDGGLATSAKINQPRGIDIDASGTLYVSDFNNNRVRTINVGTGIITTFAGNGTAGFSGDGGLATAANINNAFSVAFDASGDAFINDFANNRVRRVDVGTGIITTYAGGGGFGGDGGAATSALINLPSDVVVDASQNYYIADSNNNRIRKVAASSGIITTVAGSAGIGFAGDGGPATSAQLNNPYRVALDASGNLYIADRANQRIRKVDAISGIITTLVGNGTAGFSGDGGSATSSQINNPRGIAFDSSGNLYIADSTNNRVRKVAASTGIITAIAGTGSATFSGDGGLATAAGIGNPFGIAVDAAGNVYVSESANNRIRKIDAGTGIITTFAGNGSAAYSGDGGLATSAALNRPSGIALDPAGDLYISDVSNSALRRVDAGSGNITTVAGTGTGGFSGDGGPAATAQLNNFNGVIVAASGDLYVADSGNNRVRRISLDVPAITAASMQDSDADGIVDSIALTYDEALADTAAGANGFDVTSASDHGSCTGETADPSATNTLTVNFNCTTVGTTVGDLTLVFTSNSGIVNAAGQQARSVTLTSASSPALTDGAKPVLVSSTPADGATHVSRTDDLTLRFSEPMDQTSTQSAFSLTPTAGVNAFSWSATDTVLTVNPASSLAESRNYTIGLTGTAQSSASGDPALAVTSVSFTTASSGGGPVSTPPSVSLLQPNGGESLSGGTSYQIIWSSGGDGVASFRLSLSTNGAGSYSSLATGLTSGSYLWNIPTNLQTTQGRIRVEALNDSGTVIASAASQSDFTVTGTTAPPPSGGGGGGGSTTPPPAVTTGIEGSDTSSSGQGAMTRAAANLALPPSYPVDALVKLPDDGNPATEVDSTVYYLGLDAKRHPFINAKAYASWYADFSQVQIIDGPTLASIPLGAPILTRPGTLWVKIVSDPKTYYVEPGYKLRWIKDEATAEKLGGPDWNKNIVDVDTAFFVLYSAGADIDAATLATTWPSGTLIDSSLNLQDDRHLLGLRWYVTGGKKRAFIPDSAFGANNFQSRFAWNHVEDLGSTQTLNSLPSGPDITGQEDALFSLMH